jgi:hypothetical protein
VIEASPLFRSIDIDLVETMKVRHAHQSKHQTLDDSKATTKPGNRRVHKGVGFGEPAQVRHVLLVDPVICWIAGFYVKGAS